MIMFSSYPVWMRHDSYVNPSSHSFGLTPGAPLNVLTPLMSNQSYSTSLLLNSGGSVMKMSPLTNIQMAVKNNIDVFYFSVVVPIHVLFTEEGQMGEFVCERERERERREREGEREGVVLVILTFFLFSRSQGLPCHVERDPFYQ